jgi:nucleotide-binding universal stress UspA family protein
MTNDDGPSPSRGPIDERPVVVGYNGRQHSRAALMWAAAEAMDRDVPLLVVFAANYPGMTLGPGPGLLTPEPGALDAAEEVMALGVSEALAAHPGLRVSGATEVTKPVQTLVEASTEAALLVIGTRGFGQTIGTLIGSVAFAVAAEARCPVIIVKEDPASRPVGKEARIVVGTDGSAPSLAAVGFAADRAATASTALEIVTCTGEQADSDPAELRTSAELITRSAAERLRNTHPGLMVTTRVEDSPPARTLVAASAGAALLVVGTRGHGAFRGMLLGSVSHAMISGARCDVAVVGEGQG